MTVSTRMLMLKTQHVCIHIALMQFNVNYRIMIRNVKLLMAHHSSKNKYRFVPYSWAVEQCFFFSYLAKIEALPTILATYHPLSPCPRI